MQYLTLLKTSFASWKKDKATQLAASTAYYTVFSLAPLLVIIISLTGFLFDSETVQTQIITRAQALVGTEGAKTIESMLNAVEKNPHSLVATLIGFCVLIVGATGLLIALQDAFNTIWTVTVKKEQGGLLRTVLRRVFSLGLILAIGFLLMVSLALSAAVSIFIQFAGTNLTWLSALIPIIDVALSFFITTILFAFLFKYLPDVVLRWREAIIGAALTAFFFTIGKNLLGWYLGQKNFTSAYGVAGSLIVLLVWVNYSAQILFFGVEFTKAYVEHARGLPTPKKHAEYNLPKVDTASRGSLALLDAVLAAAVLVFEFKLFKWRRSVKKITDLFK